MNHCDRCQGRLLRHHGERWCVSCGPVTRLLHPDVAEMLRRDVPFARRAEKALVKSLQGGAL